MEKIKLGEIKAHSIMLICPEVEISFDRYSEQSLCDAIENLKCDPNVRDLALGCVPSINRAFSLIEKRGATKKKSKTAMLSNLKKIGNRSIVKLNEISPDALSVWRVYFSDGTEVLFDSGADDEIYIHSTKEGEYTFIYKSRLERVSESSSDFDDVDLDEGVAEIIPYFVKSELISCEDKDGAKTARLLFDGILNELASGVNGNSQGFVETVYSYR